MRTLILSIKTVGELWSDLDEVTQLSLTAWMDQVPLTPDEQAAKLAAVKAGLGRSPLTGRISALGLFDPDRCEGAVYYVGEGDVPDSRAGEYIYKSRSEAELLAEFWEGAAQYDAVVTFGGRSFDLPFLLHRAVVHGVQPTKELMKYRYLAQQSVPYHIDLQDELTFYGAMPRRPNFQLFCRAYGITCPPLSHPVELVCTTENKQCHSAHLVQSCADDVIAKAQLYQKWRTNFASDRFSNLIDF